MHPHTAVLVTFHGLEEVHEIAFCWSIKLYRYVNVIKPKRLDGGRFVCERVPRIVVKREINYDLISGVRDRLKLCFVRLTRGSQVWRRLAIVMDAVNRCRHSDEAVVAYWYAA